MSFFFFNSQQFKFSLAPKCSKQCRCTIGRGRGISGNFHPILYYKFRGWHKSGGARATVASPSLAPLCICKPIQRDCLPMLIITEIYLISKYLHINEGIKGSQALMDNKIYLKKYRDFFFTLYAILALCGFSEETKNA